jgi:ABC-type uncharacterized transport system permease subunit
MIQLFLHGIGDYYIQNDWMALNKKLKTWKGELACQIHCITYALPFLFICSWLQVLLIYISHYILDRTHIIEWILAYKNGVNHIKNFGFSESRPQFLTIWLLIITDNLTHLITNALIIKYVG